MTEREGETETETEMGKQSKISFEATPCMTPFVVVTQILPSGMCKV